MKHMVYALLAIMAAALIVHILDYREGDNE